MPKRRSDGGEILIRKAEVSILRYFRPTEAGAAGGLEVGVEEGMEEGDWPAVDLVEVVWQG